MIWNFPNYHTLFHNRKRDGDVCGLNIPTCWGPDVYVTESQLITVVSRTVFPGKLKTHPTDFASVHVLLIHCYDKSGPSHCKNLHTWIRSSYSHKWTHFHNHYFYFGITFTYNSKRLKNTVVSRIWVQPLLYKTSPSSLFISAVIQWCTEKSGIGGIFSLDLGMVLNRYIAKTTYHI